ncbi:MAG: 2Fe-2S iron-sulfur cluster-binding protein [Imperialibacter sp.]|uniref:2Fe-2S iron-sulfur cluster-binding protein n=1 Tax=Imperialibacter sp. TaxID=2038411 RepID=UPI0032EE1719
MPKIVIQNLNNKRLFSENSGRTLLSILQENYIDWMHACGGKGRCTTCKAIVHEGLALLGELTEAEKKYVEMGRLESNERLACQCRVSNDIEISVADENKFPHIDYTG